LTYPLSMLITGWCYATTRIHDDNWITDHRSELCTSNLYERKVELILRVTRRATRKGRSDPPSGALLMESSASCIYPFGIPILAGYYFHFPSQTQLSFFISRTMWHVYVYKMAQKKIIEIWRTKKSLSMKQVLDHIS